MKRIFKTIILAISIALSVISCGKDESIEDGIMVWDIYPITLTLRALDGDQDLFDPSYEGNIINSVSVYYNREEYKVEPVTKACYVEFTGLTYENWSDKNNNIHVLVFGSFDGTKNYKNLTFTVNWPDGKKDVVEYSRTFKWDKHGVPVINQTTTVNGEKGRMYIERKF